MISIAVALISEREGKHCIDTDTVLTKMTMPCYHSSWTILWHWVSKQFLKYCAGRPINYGGWHFGIRAEQSCAKRYNPVSFSLARATHCCWYQERPVLSMWSGVIFNGITVYIKCIRNIFILSRCTTWSFAIPQKVLISKIEFWSEGDFSYSEHVLYLLV